jgi:hypothetical protein
MAAQLKATSGAWDLLGQTRSSPLQEGIPRGGGRGAHLGEAGEDVVVDTAVQLGEARQRLLQGGVPRGVRVLGLVPPLALLLDLHTGQPEAAQAGAGGTRSGARREGRKAPCRSRIQHLS